MTGIKEWVMTFFRSFGEQLRLILHDKGILVFLIVLPLAYPVIYSLIYNPEVVRDVKVVVVDNDRSALSRELVRRMDATPEVRITGYAAEMGEARRAVNEHECYGIIEIPEGFGRKVAGGEGSQMVLYSDMSLMLRYKGFLIAATNVSQSMGADLLNETMARVMPLAETLVTGDPMGINEVSLGNVASGFDSFVMPGVLILILQQCLILAVGMSGGARLEKRYCQGYMPLLHRRRTLPRLGGESLCFFLFALVPMVWLLYYVPLIFSFPQAGDIMQELLFVIPMVISAIALGFCLQGLVWQRESIFIVWVVTSIMFLFMSGLTWPQSAMPPFWKALGSLAPSTWGVQGFIRMTGNGATLWEVRDSYLYLWELAALYSVTAYLVQRFVVAKALTRRHVTGRYAPCRG